jgi:hypothetical protein
MVLKTIIVYMLSGLYPPNRMDIAKKAIAMGQIFKEIHGLNAARYIEELKPN